MSALAFQEQQYALAAHIRDPENVAVPEGISQRRIDIYDEIFFNGLNDAFANNFPVLNDLMSEEKWESMIRDFMVKHKSETPLFTQIGLEFIDYLQNDREPKDDDFPFMTELAHYEYAELAVSISDADEGLADYDPNGDLLDGHPVVSPVTWNLSYQYPVHQICDEFLPEEAPEQPTHLVVYRDRQDEVHFLEINAVTQRLLAILQENEAITGLLAVEQIATELNQAGSDVVINAGKALLADLRERNIILGALA